jgi:hypothetical protein
VVVILDRRRGSSLAHQVKLRMPTGSEQQTGSATSAGGSREADWSNGLLMIMIYS